jgi:Ca2+-binding RTX toxin-like protein
MQRLQRRRCFEGVGQPSSRDQRSLGHSVLGHDLAAVRPLRFAVSMHVPCLEVSVSGCLRRCSLVLALAIGTPGLAQATVTSSFNAGSLTVASDAGDSIVVTCSGVGGTVLVNGANPGTGAVACALVTQLSITGGPGANTIDIQGVTSGSYTTLTSRNVDGGGGDDVLQGSGSVDLLVGGGGADTVNGNAGNDIVFLGEGDDLSQWDPGDGSDIVEGQAGVDKLRFNASNANEIVVLSANGQRLLMTRDVGSVTMDMDEIEQVEAHALGGADQFTINNLAGTDATQVLLRLAGTLGGGSGDGAADVVSIVGGSGTDNITGDVAAGAITVSHGATEIVISTLEAAIDNLTLNGGDGNDSLTVGIGLAGLVGALTADGGIGTDTVVVRGSAGNDVVNMAATAPFVSSAALPLIDVLSAENVRVDALGGADTCTVSGNVAALFALTLDGGDGDDTLLGGNGADVLLGGNGSDLLDGNQGSDIAFLGDANDVFQWDPGDGSDIVEGQAGVDTLRFNASNANEIVVLSANGQRLLMTRDVGSVTMDMDEIEQVEAHALGGADQFTINNLAGTDATQVLLRLAGTLGGGSGDAAADTVTVNGSNVTDSIVVSASGAITNVVRGGLTVSVHVAEPANDRLVVNGLGGDDLLSFTPLVPQLLQLTVDGGSHATSAGDLVSLTGESLAESYTVAPNAARVALARTAPAPFSVDLHASEWLHLALDGGADTLNTQGLVGTSQLLEGGAPSTVPGDTLNVAGFTGDVFESPISMSGFAPIVHSGFEQSTNQQVIEAFLSGAQETPPNPSSGRGFGTVTLNAAQDAIAVFLEYSGLSGNNSLLHIHGPAPRGVAAPAIITLPVSGTTSGSFNVGPLAITPTQRDQLKSGLWYFNVHSTAPNSTNGEIRGQLDNILFRDGFD